MTTLPAYTSPSTRGPRRAMRTDDAPRRRLSPLVPLLAVSLAVHGAVIALWPVAPVTSGESTPAGRVALQLVHAPATDSAAAARADSGPRPTPEVRREPRPTAPAEPSASPAPRRPPVPDATATVATRAPSDASAPVSATPSTPPAPRPATDFAAYGDRGASLESRISGSLQHALVAHFEYPLIARRRGWEGVVRVGLRVEADGQLSALRVIASSGFASLDRAALKSLTEVGRLPDAIDWLHGAHFDLELPVRYRLIGS